MNFVTPFPMFDVYKQISLPTSKQIPLKEWVQEEVP